MSKGWHRESGNRVVFYYSENGKQRKVPRSETQGLDGEPDHNIQLARDIWGKTHLRAKPQFSILTHPDSLNLVDQYAAFALTRGKDKATVSNHKMYLCKYLLPYFVQKEALTSPTDWPLKSVSLLAYLQSLDLNYSTIHNCNVAMRVFWKWLTEERLASGTLILRNPIRGQATTPLNFTVTPEQIIAHKYGNAQMRLLGLIGFFFSLRPQETLALKPSDFRVGTVASKIEACKAMKGSGHYDRLAVNIQQQRKSDQIKSPKNNSKGYVACFSEIAAKEIVLVLSKLPPAELIFEGNYWAVAKEWRTKGYPGLSLKDLRRSSIYWLGNHGKVDFTVLKLHARHQDPSTTALYIRRPEDQPIEATDWDLEA